MPGQIIRMVMGKKNVLETCLSLCKDLLVAPDIVYWIDDDAFLVGLDIVGEDGKL